MSGSENGSSGDSGPGRREVAHRLFACEFDASSLEYADSDEERAPKYVITPTGARVNRLFVVGVLTEVERVNEDVVRARVVDPTGAFVVYAGQYQPDSLAFLERADAPAFVAVTGKANTFQPEDSDRVYTSVRPESIAEVDAETRDRWTTQAAEHTLRRVGEFAGALERDTLGDPTSGLALAREEYGTTPAYLAALRETALDAVRLVAGEVEEVAAPSVAPGDDDGRTVDLADLQGVSTPEPVEDSEADTDMDSPTDTADTSEPESPESPSTEPEAKTEVTAEPEPDTGGSQTADAGADGDDQDAETPAEPNGMATDTARETTDTVEAAPEEPGPDAEGESADLGEFDVGDSEPSGPDGEDELYEFDPEERAEIESEFDMDFASGNQVKEPGEADIDVSDPTGEAEEAGTDPSDTTEMADSEGVATNPETEATAEPEPSGGDDGPGEEDVDIEDRAMAVMQELADGDGADREAVIERVASETGVEPEEVDDAIESALLSGRCYEPQDDVLKPI